MPKIKVAFEFEMEVDDINIVEVQPKIIETVTKAVENTDVNAVYSGDYMFMTEKDTNYENGIFYQDSWV